MRKHFSTVILAIVVALAVSLVTLNYEKAPQDNTALLGKESPYDRVMRTRTIRCGYFAWPPFVIKDPNSGKLSGLYVDVAEALGSIMDLKIEWAQELNFGTYLEDLAAGRYDMECSGGWANAKRGQIVFYSRPYAYMPYVALVRPNDRRFDADPALINKPGVKVATMDGETTSILRHLRFPFTQDVSLPQNSPIADVIFNVVSGKADVTFTDTLTASEYLKENPGKLKAIRYNPPLYLIAVSPSLPPDIRMKQMVDVATDQLLNSGTIDAILKKYETGPGIFLRAALPFRN
ncbi:MAG: transporter substrate-binding domain-containing protein [Alphaproteobacteria bacterium]|nr:transporter substrate-binding domain-containing protein [Alphaproteobacteria bacterium]